MSAAVPLSEVLQPLTIGDLTLANRIVMAPLTRGRTGLDKGNLVPTDVLATYYEQRASAGLIITEATAISEQGYGWYGAPAIYEEAHAEGWKKVVDRVHAKGGKIFLQLWHMGRQSHSSFHASGDIVSASPIAVPSGQLRDKNYNHVSYETPRALRKEEVKGVVADFKRAAELCQKAGMDGVEVHGANGYLIDQFLQTVSNTRTDEYGGSDENRARLLFEVIDAVATVFPLSRIGLRISPNGAFGGMGSPENKSFFPWIAAQIKEKYPGFGYLHIMDGLAFGFHNKCAPVTLFDIKAAFGGVVMGNIDYTKEKADGAIRSGAADLIAFGRLYISNPDLVERFRDNKPLAEAGAYNTWYGDNDKKNGTTGFQYTDFPNAS